MTKTNIPAPTVDWDEARCHLLIDYGRAADLPRHEESTVLATVVLDGDGTVIDADIMELPARVTDALGTYAVSVRQPPENGISLDADAAWLWLHLADGVPARQFRGKARARLAFDGGELAEVDLTLLPTTAQTHGDSRRPC